MIPLTLALVMLEPAAVPSAAADPVALFRSACLNGQVQLDPGNVKTLTFKKLPNSARDVIGRAIYRGPGAPAYPDQPLPKDFPNAIYRIGAQDIFLIATTPEPVPGDRFADSCMVVWKGDGFDAARSVIMPNAPNHGHAPHHFDADYFSANDGQQVLTAALLNNWTILKVSPTATEPSPPVVFPGAKKN
jgi:hypothetical protein